MCGRYTLTSSAAAVAEQFGLEAPPDLEARYNVAPTQPVPVVRRELEGEARRLEMRRWGLVPHWAKEPGIGARLINARAETVAEKPAFRVAFRRRRCLVPADGFYEWKPHPRQRRPHYVHLPEGELFAFAGLFEDWRGRDGSAVASCTLITTAASERIRSLHHRMPVILAPEAYAAWLDPGQQDPVEVSRLLDSPCMERLCYHPVSRRVNDPRHDAPDCREEERLPSADEEF